MLEDQNNCPMQAQHVRASMDVLFFITSDVSRLIYSEHSSCLGRILDKLTRGFPADVAGLCTVNDVLGLRLAKLPLISFFHSDRDCEWKL